jgi:hypothetical protein
MASSDMGAASSTAAGTVPVTLTASTATADATSRTAMAANGSRTSIT